MLSYYFNYAINHGSFWLYILLNFNYCLKSRYWLMWLINKLRKQCIKGKIKYQKILGFSESEQWAGYFESIPLMTVVSFQLPANMGITLWRHILCMSTKLHFHATLEKPVILLSNDIILNYLNSLFKMGFEL